MTDIYGNELSNDHPRKYEPLYTFEQKEDYHFAMELTGSFVQPPNGHDAWGHDIIFDFVGDDDFWLYVDGELVIDLGGIHSAVPGSVNYSTGDVYVNGTSTTLRDLFYNNYIVRGHTADEAQAYVDEIFHEKIVNGETRYVFKDYSSHTIRIFYMERGGNISYCRLRFNMPTLTDNALMIGKELELDEDSTDVTGAPEAVEMLSKNLPYTFYVWETDGDGTTSGTGDIKIGADGKPVSLFPKDTEYHVNKEGHEITSPSTHRHVGEDGSIILYPGEKAIFNNILQNPYTGKFEDRWYIVEERIPADLAEQYGDVLLTNSITPVEIKDENGKLLYKSYYTGVQHTNVASTHHSNSMVNIFTNKLNADKLSTFSITKKIADGASINQTDFKFEIKLGGELLKETAFVLADKSPISTDENGILTLKAGQVATLVNHVISGTEYSVKEVLDAGSGVIVHYGVTGDNKEDDITPDYTVGANGVSGDFNVGSKVLVTVTNSTYDTTNSHELIIKKEISGNMSDSEDEFGFTVEIIEESLTGMFLLSGTENTPVEDIGSEAGKKLEITLGKGEEYRVVGIPNGAIVKITEAAEGYIPTVKIGDEELDVVKDGEKYFVTIKFDKTKLQPVTVTFNNVKNTEIPPTGVDLDRIPYYSILIAVVGMGVLLTAAGRRRRMDE